MKKIHELECGGYYLLSSLATARSCYFENEDEILKFRLLFKRYLTYYINIHKVYMSSEGYEILIRVKSLEVVKRTYIEYCKKLNKEVKVEFIKEPWRIISEQMRIFGSVYAKWVNSERDRSGGLVKERYRRYYFESYEEFEMYKNEMREGSEIRSQRNKRYQVSTRWIRAINWSIIRGVERVEGLVDIDFKNYVVQKLIKSTFSLHSPPP
jgi:hypothetical protein